MPDKIIEIPNVGRIAFPDTMSADEINAAAAKLYAEKNGNHPPPDPKHSWVDTAVDWLPTVAGAAGGIIGGIGGTVAGMGVGGVPGAVGGAALGGAAGEAAKQLINDARGKPTTSTADAMKGIAGQAAVQGGSELAGAGVGAVMSAVAPRVMQSALKPTLGTIGDMVKGRSVPRVVQTLLDEGVNVTPKGLEKVNTLLSSSQADVKAAIAAVAQTSPGVNPYSVASRLGETAQRFGAQVNPAADLAAVGDVGNKFLQEHGGQMIPLEQAQALKQGTYSMLRKKYGQMGAADVEAEKALARGLKEEIAQQVPGIDALNARTGDLSQASQSVGRRVAMAANRDLGGIGDLAISHPMTFLTVAMDRSPAVKSLIARGMYNAAGSAAKVSPQLIRAAVQAIASSGEEGQ